MRLEISILDSDSNESAAAAVERSGERADWRSVLVVSPEADMRSYVRRCLLHDAIRVVEAMDDESAFNATREALPDLVIIDLAVADPLEAALGRAIHARPALARVPVIVITVEELAAGGAKLLGGARSGAILVKPFNARQLCGEVERLLNQRPPG